MPRRSWRAISEVATDLGAVLVQDRDASVPSPSTSSEVGEVIKSERFVKVTRTALRDGIALTTGQNYVVQIAPALRVDLEIEPDASSTMDDKYTLRSTDQAERYSRTLTVKDDKIAGDHMITLEFEDVQEGLSYTLEVDQGAEGGKYTVFEAIPYEDLRD